MSISMLGGMFDSIKQIFMEIFEYIPKIIYLLYSSLACVLDVLQLFFRKVAGLDVYYVDGKPVTGDLVTNFIGGILGFNEFKGQYSALTTVFWSFILFGVIMVFISTFVAIIKSHYSYDDKAAKGPMQYVYTGGKALINIAAVPIIVFIGLFVSQALLTALDSLTSVSNSTISDLYGSNVDQLQEVKTQRGDETYIFYDFFGVSSAIKYKSYNVEPVSEYNLALVGSTNATFSGAMFKVAAFNGNRVRTGEFQLQGSESNIYTGMPGQNTGLTLFNDTSSDEELAEMIDVAFASNLHLNVAVELNYDGAVPWPKFINGFRTQKFSAFSKFNVGLVWYYYDLWQFNFIVGFAGVIVCASLFINIVMGLITRLFMSIGLFLIAPPLFGLAPVDGGKAAGKWKEEFIKQVLMTYGAVVGMNIFFLILPYMNSIDFFNIPIADVFVQALIIIVGLVTIKAFIALVSGLIGAADANKTGSDISKEVGSVAGKAVKMTAGAAKVALRPDLAIGRAAVGIGSMAVGAAQKVAGAVSNPFGINTLANRMAERRNRKRGDEAEDLARKSALIHSMHGETIDRDEFMHRAMEAGLSAKDAKKMYRDIGSPDGTGTFDEGVAGANYVNANNVRNHVGFGTAIYNNEADIARYRTRQAVAKQQGDRWAQHASWGNRALTYGAGQVNKSGLLTPYQNFVSSIGGDGLDEFKKNAFGKKPDDAAKTAANTARMVEGLQQLQAGQNNLHDGLMGSASPVTGARSGGALGNMNAGIHNIGTGIEGMHSDMNTGFGGVRTDLATLDSDINTGLSAVNSNISAIEAETAEINAKNSRQIQELEKANRNLKKVQKAQADAHRQREQIKDKVDVLVKDSKNSRKPKI